MPEATHAEIVINARVDEVMDAIADLPSYPLWSEGVGAAEVMERDSEGRPAQVVLTLDFWPIRDDLQLDYRWREDRVDWWLTHGTLLSDLKGTYTCRDTGDGAVLVTYDLLVDLIVPMISAVRQRGERHIVRSALRGLKRHVEDGRALREPSVAGDG